MTVNTYTGAKNNAELIEQVYELRHLDDAWLVLDSTVNTGKFWKKRRPPRLVTLDIDPLHMATAMILGDGTRLPFADETFDATWTDGPYKLNGRPTDSVDMPYGVHKWQGRAERHELLVGLLGEGARVTKVGGRVFAKCQPQVNGGKLWFQQRILSAAGEEQFGLELVDELYLPTGRSQPLRAPCLRCGAALMRRETGAWGRVVVGTASDEAKAAAFICDDGGGAHVPGDLSPQQHSYSNISILLIFIKLPPEPEEEPTLF